MWVWQGLSRLNDWKSPAYVTRERADILNGRSIYDILVKQCKGNK